MLKRKVENYPRLHPLEDEESLEKIFPKFHDFLLINEMILLAEKRCEKEESTGEERET